MTTTPPPATPPPPSPPAAESVRWVTAAEYVARWRAESEAEG